MLYCYPYHGEKIVGTHDVLLRSQQDNSTLGDRSVGRTNSR